MRNTIVRRIRSVTGYEHGEPKDNNPAFRKYKQLKRLVGRGIIPGKDLPKQKRG